jgi:hypothetical protein
MPPVARGSRFLARSEGQKASALMGFACVSISRPIGFAVGPTGLKVME